MQAGAWGGGGSRNREDAVSVYVCRGGGGHSLGMLLSRRKALEENYCRGDLVVKIVTW